VARQEVQIKMEEQENRIAKEEWALYQKANPNESASDLTLRKPQMAGNTRFLNESVIRNSPFL
jgi:hypothetical protein